MFYNVQLPTRNASTVPYTLSIKDGPLKREAKLDHLFEDTHDATRYYYQSAHVPTSEFNFTNVKKKLNITKF